MRRRDLLFGAPASLLADQKKLLLPTDKPDEHGFRLMWYNPSPPIDISQWKLEIKGLVEKPLVLTLDELRALPQEKQSSRLKCVQGWSARAEWGGFRFGTLLDLAKPKKEAQALRFDCADKWFEYMSFKEMSNPRVLLTLDMAGKPLSDNHGAPLRLIDPTRYGYRSAKLITTITFVDEGKGSMACDLGPYYSATGEIVAGYDTPLDLVPEAALTGGRIDPKYRRKVKRGEITEY